jgi:hypothetical protein
MFRVQGVSKDNKIKILIPYDHKYRKQQDFINDDDGEWTIQLGSELKQSYIVEGECFDRLDELSIDDKNFVNDVIKPFEKRNKVFNPYFVDDNFIGSRNMWRIEVKC